MLRERHPSDIAEALRNLAPPEALAVFNQLDGGRAAQVLSDVGPQTIRYPLEHASLERIAAFVARLPMDDAPWVVSRAAPTRAEAILTELSARTPAAAEDVGTLLNFGEATMGRLMTEKFVRLSAASTIIRGLACGRSACGTPGGCCGVLLGLLLGLIALGRATLWGSGLQLSFVVALTILAIVTWANLIGAVIPLAAQRLKIDPALVSAPFITTLVDATGLIIYFLIANALLTVLHYRSLSQHRPRTPCGRRASSVVSRPPTTSDLAPPRG
jgi:Mg/Co/Ni transporter MgtE